MDLGWGWDSIHPRTADVGRACLLIKDSIPPPISYPRFVLIWPLGAFSSHHLSGQIWVLHPPMFSSH